VITWGIPGTSMPEFTTRLNSGEIADLVAYVMTLGGATAAAAPAPASQPRPMTVGARAGRALFFDAARTGACGSCHELDGWGVAVAPDIARLPAQRFSDLRDITVRNVVTARPAGEASFAAVVIERTERRVRVYDLTAEIPVLRTFRAASVTVEPGAEWRHRQAAERYTAAELETIVGYLRWRAGAENDIH
jgi:mono/diheme cytochrome c family protein